MSYSKKLKERVDLVAKSGFPIYAMIHMYRKRSKLNQEIPEPVLMSVCLEIIKRADKVDKTFPYFLTVLQQETRKYFSQLNEKEGRQLKQETMSIKNIMVEILKRVEREP